MEHQTYVVVDIVALTLAAALAAAVVLIGFHLMHELPCPPTYAREGGAAHTRGKPIAATPSHKDSPSSVGWLVHYGVGGALLRAPKNNRPEDVPNALATSRLRRTWRWLRSTG